ncbi:MAG: D-glycero-alpha-D-manno-heptose-1,7-bisphosphate 7-phosphatase, partial [Thermomicrobiales bacterium]
MAARAIFLDRDGTLVEPRHYPTRPEELVLFAGVADELRRLQEAGFRLVLVTNQSGLARGYFSEAALAAMHEHLARELARSGVRLAGIYYCPHHPEGSVPDFTRDCDCRKPAPGLILQASADLALDPARSWLVGDILDDIEAGWRAGCRTVLVDLDTESFAGAAGRPPAYVARHTSPPRRRISGVGEGGPPGVH